jgi:hypothetical protein
VTETDQILHGRDSGLMSVAQDLIIFGLQVVEAGVGHVLEILF